MSVCRKSVYAKEEQKLQRLECLKSTSIKKRSDRQANPSDIAGKAYDPREFL